MNFGKFQETAHIFTHQSQDSCFRMKQDISIFPSSKDSRSFIKPLREFQSDFNIIEYTPNNVRQQILEQTAGEIWRFEYVNYRSNDSYRQCIGHRGSHSDNDWYRDWPLNPGTLVRMDAKLTVYDGSKLELLRLDGEWQGHDGNDVWRL